MRIRPPILLGVVAIAGCTPRPPAGAQVPTDSPTMRDSVMVPGNAQLPPDVILAGRLELEDAARFDTVTVGEAGLLRATTSAEAESARRASASGMYLADPFRVLRLEPQPGRPAAARLVREVSVGSPAFSEMVVRLTGRGRAPVLRFEHAGVASGGGRRMPSAVAVELLPTADGRGYGEARLLLGDGQSWSEQDDEDLPDLDWQNYAHRIGVVISRDGVEFAIDGNAVLEERVMLHGPPAAPRLEAETDRPAAGVVILQWTAVLE